MGRVREGCGMGVGMVMVWEECGNVVGIVWEGCGMGVQRVWEGYGNGVGMVWDWCWNKRELKRE